MKGKLKAGEIVTLKAVRASELGVFLDAETGDSGDDILLHKAQQTRPVQVGDEVEVLLYLDPKDRLTATMRLPEVKEGEIIRLPVAAITDIGAFLDAGSEKQILLPFREMRGKPRQGDEILVMIYRDKTGRLAATMKIEDEVRKLARPARNFTRGDTFRGVVYNITPEGAFICDRNYHLGFIHHGEMTGPLSVGQDITVRVTYVREDGRLNLSMRETKEVAQEIDAAMLLDYLRSHNGMMPYADTTPPEVIREKFNLSKAAFKRALGKLLKEGKVRQEDGWTYLCEN